MAKTGLGGGVHVINAPTGTANFTQGFSKATGSLLGSGLEYLAQNKLNQMKFQNLVSQGYSPEQAKHLLWMDDAKLQHEAMGQFAQANALKGIQEQDEEVPQETQFNQYAMGNGEQAQPQEQQNQGISPEIMQLLSQGNKAPALGMLQQFAQPQQQKPAEIQPKAGEVSPTQANAGPRKKVQPTEAQLLGQALSKGAGKTATGVNDKQQAAIDKSQAAYNKNLDSRLQALRDITDKAGKLKELLEKGAEDESQVGSGWTGYAGSFAPRILGSASEQFATTADDVAAALTSLDRGVQTISKIRFNQQRKPNLGQTRLTQEERVEELLDYGRKGFLEEDLRNHLVESNGGKNPENLSGKVKKFYTKLEKSIPPVPPNAEQGQVFNDKKNGVKWVVEGPIMRFFGFIGE